MKMVTFSILLVVMLAVTGGLPGAKATTVTEPPTGQKEGQPLAEPAFGEEEGQPLAEPAFGEDEGQPLAEPAAEEGEHQVAKRAVGCPCGWSRYRNRCFRYFSSALPWYRAQRYCQSVRANLASVHSGWEEHFVRRLAFYRPTWIGFSNAQQARHWFWINGKRVNYNNWCRGEPNNVGGNQHCALVNWTSRKCWDDQNCGTYLGFVCARKR